jgi:hypothetical protein
MEAPQNIYDLLQVGILASVLGYALKGVLSKQWVPGWYAAQLEKEVERLQNRSDRFQEIILKGAEVTARATSITETAVGAAAQIIKEKR